MKSIFLSLIVLMLIFSCSKKDDNPSPSTNNNNPGGGGTNGDTYFTNTNQDFACDELYENVTYKGHTFMLTRGLCPTSEEITYRQFFTNKNIPNYPYTIDATAATGSVAAYDESTGSYDLAATIAVADVKHDIQTNGAFILPEVGFNNPAYGTVNSSIKTGFYLQNSNGFNPDSNKVHNSWSVNDVSINDFYYKITSIKRVYPKSVSNDPYYVIEGSKRILLRYYNGIDAIAYHDTLVSTFKVVRNFAE